MNAILEQLHQVITTTLCTTELDMANSVVTSNIDAFLTDVAWAICSTCHIFGRHMLFDIPFLATKLENTGNTRQTLTWNGKISHAMIGTTKLVTKYFYEKMVISANQRVGMNMMLGLSHQFI